MIKNYNDFIQALLAAGFSLSSGSADGIYAVIPWGWNEATPYETPVRWHTGCPETDPWEWRTRVLYERNDIAYGKVFFKKSGFITKEWYPYFLAARRGRDTFQDAYVSGTISHAAKRIYDTIIDNGILPSHDIKRLAGFAKEEKSAFERGLVELQMKMFITVCGAQQKISQKGDAHGMPSCMFCTVEHFWGRDVFEHAAEMSVDEACDAIREQVLRLNPLAEEKRITKFILG